MKKKIFISLFIIVHCTFIIEHCLCQWVEQYSGTSQILHSVFFVNVNTGFISGDNGTLLRTTNGGINWTNQLSLPSTVDYQSIYFINENTGWVVGTDYFGSTILKTTNNGINWTTVLNQVSADIFSLSFIDTNNGWGAGWLGSIIKTTDGGQNWVEIMTGGDFFYSIFFLNQNTGWVVGDANIIYKSTNGGYNWESQYNGQLIYFYTTYFIDLNTGWAAGQYPIQGVILKTTNSGINWETQYNTASERIKSIYFINSDTGYAAGYLGVILKTTNGGTNWISQSFSSELMFNSVHFENSNTGWITGTTITGNAGKIYKTINGGLTAVRSISSEVPETFSLEQNYPNPFNSMTNIKFSVPLWRGVGGRIVTIKIFDISGKEVATLVNEKLNPGTYEIRFDAGDLPSGIYFYQMQTENFTSTKKLILLK